MIPVKKIGVAVVSGLIAFVLAVYLEEARTIINNILSQVFGVSPSIVGYLVVAGVFAITCAFFSGWMIWEGIRRIPFGQRLRDKIKEFFHTKSVTRIELNNKSIFGEIDPRLAHLTIHFSSKTDTPDTPNPAFGRYVANNRKMLARWVSTLLEPHIKNHRMNWHTHASREKTLEYFSTNKYNVKEQDATLEELEISIDFK